MISDNMAESKILNIENSIECHIVRRINRFVVKVRWQGNYYQASINNTGRLHQFLVKGRKGLCVRNEMTEDVTPLLRKKTACCPDCGSMILAIAQNQLVY